MITREARPPVEALERPGSVKWDNLSRPRRGFQEPTAWQPGFFQRPWVLAVVLLAPLVMGLLATLLQLLSPHGAGP